MRATPDGKVPGARAPTSVSSTGNSHFSADADVNSAYERREIEKKDTANKQKKPKKKKLNSGKVAINKKTETNKSESHEILDGHLLFSFFSFFLGFWLGE